MRDDELLDEYGRIRPEAFPLPVEEQEDWDLPPLRPTRRPVLSEWGDLTQVS